MQYPVSYAVIILASMVSVYAMAGQEVDLRYGEEINETCAGCHGEFGQGSLDGEYPRLAGMDQEYLIKELRSFKERKRLNIPMVPYTNDRELPEEDIQAVVAYLRSIKLPTKLPPLDEESFDALERLKAGKQVINIARYPGDIEKGRALYKTECESCHGKDATGDSKKDAPMLAGQHSQYLLKQIGHFAQAERVHDDEPDDAMIFSSFSEQTVSDLLAYLSILDDE